LLWILSSILDQITALGAIRNFLPTHYSTAWLGLLSTPMQIDDAVKGAIAAVCYATIFWGLAFWRFTRKDITS
jgi:ABC-2 type transport system permease protein